MELNPICHLLALLGAHHIFHVSGLRVKLPFISFYFPYQMLRDNLERPRELRLIKRIWNTNYLKYKEGVNNIRCEKLVELGDLGFECVT